MVQLQGVKISSGRRHDTGRHNNEAVSIVGGQVPFWREVVPGKE